MEKSCRLLLLICRCRRLCCHRLALPPHVLLSNRGLLWREQRRSPALLFRRALRRLTHSPHIGREWFSFKGVYALRTSVSLLSTGLLC